jgi:hypothetical protein
MSRWVGAAKLRHAIYSVGLMAQEYISTVTGLRPCYRCRYCVPVAQAKPHRIAQPRVHEG